MAKFFGYVVSVKGSSDRHCYLVSLKVILFLQIVACDKSYSLFPYPESYKENVTSAGKTRNTKVIFFSNKIVTFIPESKYFNQTSLIPLHIE